MRFSIWPTTSQSWDDFHEAAAHAGRTGWDGVWAADHFMPASPPVDRPMLECFTVLSAVAALVPRVRIGSLVAGNTYRHPAVLANMVATLDHVSGGRVVLGLGAGWQENEHAAYGIEFSDVPGRLARLDEACAVMRHLLGHETRSDFQGRFYSLAGAPAEPKPLQARLPILIGGGGEKVTLRIAARWADEWNTWGRPEVLAAKGAVLERHCESIGRDPAEISRSAQVLIELPGDASEPGTLMPHRRAYPSVSGGVAEIQDLLHAYEQAKVTEFVMPDWNLGTGQRRQEAMDLFIEEVAAPFR
ncbi:MAG: TIGR03560 family F420-dependent LLM class oxidoreductase [Actinomycetota bacterium]|nr:TIGR03560 family F420-dependent LLM class oxidoreductase [Actinomycetota bacterium]